MAKGRGGGRGPLSREVQVSKKISWLLRHGAEKEGLQLGPGGYINVKDVLENRNIRSFKVTFDEVRAIVAENDKQRFSLIHISAAPSVDEKVATIPTDDAATATVEGTATTDIVSNEPLTSNKPADYLIRANQGHSIAVESEGLLTPVTEDDIPKTIVHGTTHGAWPLIVASGGLQRMGRTHVHFASGLPAGFTSLVSQSESSAVDAEAKAESQAPVISGMRNSSSVLVFLDIEKAMAAGVKFWKSENGVILSEGDEGGLIKLEFFKRVEDRKDGQGILVQDGIVVKEAPESWAKKGTGRRGGGGGRGGRGGRGT